MRIAGVRTAENIRESAGRRERNLVRCEDSYVMQNFHDIGTTNQARAVDFWNNCAPR